MFLLVGAANEGRIVRYKIPPGSNVGDFTSGYYPIGGYSYPAFAPNHDLYVKMWSYGGAIVRFDGHTGVYINEVIPFTDWGDNFLFNKQHELLAFRGGFGSPVDLCRFDCTTGALLGVFIPDVYNRFGDPLIMR